MKSIDLMIKHSIFYWLIKLNTLIFFLLFFSNKQSKAQNKFDAGIMAAVVASQVDGDNLGGFHKPGFSAGFWTSRFINEKQNMKFQLEMKFIQKGSQTSSLSLRNDSNNTNAFNSQNAYNANLFYQMKLNYVEIPFLLQYHKKGFIYELGSSIGGLVSAKIYDNYGEVPEGNADSPQSNPFNRMEWTANIGLGHKLGDRLFTIWRLDTSVLPIRPYQISANTYNFYRFQFGQYNRLLEFAFYYTFGKKKEAENE